MARNRGGRAPSTSSAASTVSCSSSDIGDIESVPASLHARSLHTFSPSDVDRVRADLLSWYDQNRRDLPWRSTASDATVSAGVRAYAVWVSEIMCQQTQIVTVLPYYARWMARWPTVESLASADLEQVNELWAGLGYYSRARRLLDGARKVVSDFGGVLPSDPVELERSVPGIGRYTAGAITSIVFGRATGVVDGNVVRVLTRLRAIGADPRGKGAIDLLWSLANALVDPARPGDFNQALMELGALVCTPTSPSCDTCPLRASCHALSPPPPVEFAAADGCTLCEPETDTGDASVTRFPRKAERKAVPSERYAMCVVVAAGEASDRFLVVQRPPRGLLAGLWEFPTVPLEGDDDSDVAERRSRVADYLVSERRVVAAAAVEKIAGAYAHHGRVEHVFSHVKHTYDVDSWRCDAAGVDGVEGVRWVGEGELEGLAASAALKKALGVWRGKEKAKRGKEAAEKVSKASKKVKVENVESGQKSIADFVQRRK